MLVFEISLVTGMMSTHHHMKWLVNRLVYGIGFAALLFMFDPKHVDEVENAITT